MKVKGTYTCSFTIQKTILLNKSMDKGCRRFAEMFREKVFKIRGK